MSHTSIVWLRNDFRLDDHPAFAAAVRRGTPVIPVFIWPSENSKDWAIGSASRWWLHQSLKSFDAELRRVGSRLILRQGDPVTVLYDFVREINADAVFWNRRYEQDGIAVDTAIKKSLQDNDIAVESFNGRLLFEPWEIHTKQDTRYRVFTPFWRACCATDGPAVPLPSPSKIKRPKSWPQSDALDSLKLEPRIDWATGIRKAWQPGSDGANAHLKQFLDDSLLQYDKSRNRPDIVGTSRLSPHLHFGEISIRRVWHTIHEHVANPSRQPVTTYLSELGWREFAHHLLYHFSTTTDEPMRDEFKKFAWQSDRQLLRAWQQGRTGYPFVDAGMRELWATGWMHNRVRMVVASFLVKDLLQPWQDGAKWFWDTLVDADLANNTLGWQWTAGCGADAVPYFRIFNPVTQGERFDPNGDYVRQWVPELRDLPTKWIHEPWKANESDLAKANVRLGEDYPLPIVDHSEARRQALEAYAKIRGNSK